MKKKILMSVIIFSISVFQVLVVAQNSEIDSLDNLLQQHKTKDTIRVKLLNEKAYKLSRVDINKTFKYAKEAEELSDYLDFKKGKAESLRLIGSYYMLKSDYLQALKYCQNSLIVNEQIRCKKGVARSLHSIGNIIYYQNDYPQALEYYQKSLIIKEEIGDKRGIAKSLNNIGIVYKELGDYSQALEYYQNSLKIKEELGDKNGIALCYNNIGESYGLNGNYIKAVEYLQKSLKLSIELGEKFIETRTYMELGSLYLKQNKIQEAHFYSKKAYIMADEIGNALLLKESSEILAKSSEFLGMYKDAYKYHVVLKTMSDSLLNVENIKKIIGLEYQYEYEKEKQADELEQQKKDAVHAEKEKRQKAVSIALFLGFGMMTALALTILLSFIQKRKANRILVEQKNEIAEKNTILFNLNEEIQAQAEELKDQNDKLVELNATRNKLFSIIAHDLKSPFNALLGISEQLVKNHTKYDNKERGLYLKFISDGARNTYNLLENLLTWSQAQTGHIKFSPEKINLEELITEIISLLEETARNKEIKLIPSSEKDLFVDADKNMINTIIRNLVSNAIKFTSKGGDITIKSHTLTDENNQM